jgi:hypothetical protein
VGPRAGLDAMEKRKIPSPCWELKFASCVVVDFTIHWAESSKLCILFHYFTLISLSSSRGSGKCTLLLVPNIPSANAKALAVVRCVFANRN